MDKTENKMPVLQPLISVVTPFKNEARFIQQCITSVIDQSYSNWELLLIDDGSTDESSAIAREFAQEYPGRIFYLEHEGHANKGVCRSRNVGIHAARGAYVALLDGDDYWLPEKLACQVRLLNENREAGMFCEATYYMNKGRNPDHENVDVPVGAEQDKLYKPTELIFKLYPIGKGYAPCMNGVFIETKLIREIGGFEESFVGSHSLYEDQAFLFKVYFHAAVYVSSLSNNIYRQRPDSSMHTLLSTGSYKQGRAFFLQWVTDYVKRQSTSLSPLISVVTPFRNEEKYLEECVESVIAQSYTNWEMLLIDDGSTDGSTAIAKQYAASFPGKIIYLEHDAHANRGVCASRNLGIEKAKGDFVALLDGDDLWMKEKLQRQVEVLLENLDAEMICEATFYMNKGRNPKIENVDVYVGVPQDQLYQPPVLLFELYPLGAGDAPCMNGILIQTELLRMIGSFEETFVGDHSLYEDQAFLFKVYFHAKVFVSSLSNNIYRQRPDSSMHKLLARGNYREGRRYFLQWAKKYIKKQEINYPALNRFFLKCLIDFYYPRLYKYTIGSFLKIKNRLKH